MHKSQKPINRFKLTPEVDKKLKEIAASMPTVPKVAVIDGKAKVLQRTHTKFFSGKQLLEQNPSGFINNGTEKIDEKKFYHEKGVRTVNFNHYLELTTHYQQRGQDGINAYYALMMQTAEKYGIIKRKTNEDGKNGPVKKGEAVHDGEPATDNQAAQGQERADS